MTGQVRALVCGGGACLRSPPVRRWRCAPPPEEPRPRSPRPNPCRPRPPAISRPEPGDARELLRPRRGEPHGRRTCCARDGGGDGRALHRRDDLARNFERIALLRRIRQRRRPVSCTPADGEPAAPLGAAGARGDRCSALGSPEAKANTRPRDRRGLHRAAGAAVTGIRCAVGRSDAQFPRLRRERGRPAHFWPATAGTIIPGIDQSALDTRCIDMPRSTLLPRLRL